jgi:hypothetical protein
MSDSIIILAGGESKRWKGEKKYMKEVCGEPVIIRTRRLVAEMRPDADIHVIGPELQRNNPNEVFALLKSRWSEDGMTYLLLGDVSWMRGTLRQVVSDKSSFTIYGRAGPNTLTGRPYEEIFAFAFWYPQNDYMYRIHIDSLMIQGEENQWDIVVLDDLYRRYWPIYIFLVLAGMHPVGYRHVIRRLARRQTHAKFVDVGESVTDDFDEPEWYEPYCKAVEPDRLIDRETPP